MPTRKKSTKKTSRKGKKPVHWCTHCRTALAEGSIGDPWRGKDKTGAFATGYRIVTVPEPLRALAIPAGAVITSINGVAVRDAASLLATATQLLTAGRPPRVLMVEMLVGGELRAIEYRVL
jgi:hypothetical protein